MRRSSQGPTDHQRPQSQRDSSLAEPNRDPSHIRTRDHASRSGDRRTAQDRPTGCCRITLTIHWGCFGSNTSSHKNLATIAFLSRHGSASSGMTSKCLEAEVQSSSQRQGQRFRHLVGMAFQNHLRLPHVLTASWTLPLSVISLEFSGVLHGCLLRRGSRRRRTSA